MVWQSTVPGHMQTSNREFWEGSYHWAESVTEWHQQVATETQRLEESQKDIGVDVLWPHLMLMITSLWTVPCRTGYWKLSAVLWFPLTRNDGCQHVMHHQPLSPDRPLERGVLQSGKVCPTPCECYCDKLIPLEYSSSTMTMPPPIHVASSGNDCNRLSPDLNPIVGSAELSCRGS